MAGSTPLTESLSCLVPIRLATATATSLSNGYVTRSSLRLLSIASWQCGADPAAMDRTIVNVGLSGGFRLYACDGVVGRWWGLIRVRRSVVHSGLLFQQLGVPSRPGRTQ